MTTNTNAQTKPEYCCSFCYKSIEQVNILVAAPPLENVSIYICNECVDVCNQIIIGGEIPPLTLQKVEPLKE